MKEDRFPCLPISKFLTENSGLPEEATGIIEASCRSSTKQRYLAHMYMFAYYCLQRNIYLAQANFEIGTEY